MAEPPTAGIHGPAHDARRSDRRPPRVTVGIPVYNGEDYVARALDSVLAQSFEDLEIVVSDNGSTDRTWAIVCDYAARDARVRVVRSEENHGAAWNFNRVLALAQGEYFEWLAHDDEIGPPFLEGAVAYLDANPRTTVYSSRVRFIDGDGQHVDDEGVELDVANPDPVQRYRALLLDWHRCFQIFGLIRLDLLRELGPMGNYSHADGILLERLAFRGPFHEIPQHLFMSRRHSQQSMELFGAGFVGGNTPDYHQYAVWFDPNAATRRVYPNWRMLWEHTTTLAGAPLSLRHRFACTVHLMHWIYRYRRPLVRDIRAAAQFTLRQRRADQTG